MKTSVSSYSFYQYVNQGKMTVLDCVAKAKEIGFDAIEFIDMPGDTLEAQKDYAKKVRAEADRLGMVINAYTIGACLYQDTAEAQEAEVERLKGQIDVAKILGAKVMRHDVTYKLGKTGSSRSFDLQLPTIAANARKVTEYAASQGITTCSENHGFIAQDSDRVERLFNAVNHDNYGLLVDVGNFLCVGEDPVMAVSRVAPYAVHAHVKDFVRKDSPSEGFFRTRNGDYICGTVVGEGIVPVKKCLSILKAAGYDGYVSVEFEGREDCLTAIARGFRNLKQMIAELEA